MKIAERRRAVIRRLADCLVRVRPVLDRCAVALYYEEKSDEHSVALGLHDEISELAEAALLAALPDGFVDYIDDEVGTIGLERDGITLELPNETPDDVVDALFSIAKLAGDGRYTLEGLALAMAEFVSRPDPQHEEQMAKLAEIRDAVEERR